MLLLEDHKDSVAFYSSLTLSKLYSIMDYILDKPSVSADTSTLRRECFEQYAKEHHEEAVELCYQLANDIQTRLSEKAFLAKK